MNFTKEEADLLDKMLSFGDHYQPALSMKRETERVVLSLAKPCPFCKSKNLNFEDEYGMQVYCVDCNARGPDGDRDGLKASTHMWDERC